MEWETPVGESKHLLSFQTEEATMQVTSTIKAPGKLEVTTSRHNSRKSFHFLSQHRKRTETFRLPVYGTGTLAQTQPHRTSKKNLPSIRLRHSPTYMALSPVYRWATWHIAHHQHHPLPDPPVSQGSLGSGQYYSLRNAVIYMDHTPHVIIFVQRC